MNAFYAINEISEFYALYEFNEINAINEIYALQSWRGHGRSWAMQNRDCSERRAAGSCSARYTSGDIAARCHYLFRFGRPFGTYENWDRYPALKRWAIVGRPFGTAERLRILRNHGDHKICSVIFGGRKNVGFRGNMKAWTKVTKVTIMDSLAPARSALAGFWLRPDSFRRFPSGSSPLISITGRGEGSGVERSGREPAGGTPALPGRAGRSDLIRVDTSCYHSQGKICHSSGSCTVPRIALPFRPELVNVTNSWRI
jgi:hypothetical protein